MPQGERRLAAIMFTDMVGYTALGQKDESLSLSLVEEQRKVVRPILLRHNGREVKTIGDAFLVEFPSAVDAVRCAYDIQRAVREFNLSLASDRRIHLRVGVHVGEIIESDGDVSGDAVNVASRIEPLAEDGGVCLTSPVYDFVRNRVDIAITSLGRKYLKNVIEPMEVYRMVMPWEKEGQYASGQPSDKKRIAVLPFANMSPDPNDEYFADGMTEELIDRLAQIREIEVIARTSVMSYKGEKKKASQMAKELGVGSLVEGSVRKAGNRVRVTAQLINGATEGHLWSSHFDANLDDIFAVQSEIAEKVAGELKIRLLETDRKTLEKKPTENTEAYGDFLRGRELLRGEQGGTALKEALALFEKAVELDHSFARARVEVAECHIMLADVYEPKGQAHANARTSLKEALTLDPDLPEAHASLASLLFNEDDLVGSEREARIALALNPSLPDPHRILFEIAATRGDPGGMVHNIETAYRLDPRLPLNIYLLGEAYFWTGRDREALEHWKKTEPVSPAYTYRGMADYYFTKGDFTKATEYCTRVQKILPEHPWVIWMEGALAASSGDRDKALLSIKKLEEDAKAGPVVLNYIAYVALALGDLDSFFARMEEALEARAQIQSFMMYAPSLAKAREDPRYQQLVKKLQRQTGLAI